MSSAALCVISSHSFPVCNGSILTTTVRRLQGASTKAIHLFNSGSVTLHHHGYFVLVQGRHTLHTLVPRTGLSRPNTDYTSSDTNTPQYRSCKCLRLSLRCVFGTCLDIRTGDQGTRECAGICSHTFCLWFPKYIERTWPVSWFLQRPQGSHKRHTPQHCDRHGNLRNMRDRVRLFLCGLCHFLMNHRRSALCTGKMNY
jgi:hypothetical protein